MLYNKTICEMYKRKPNYTQKREKKNWKVRTQIEEELESNVSLNDKDEIRSTDEALALAQFLKDNQSFSVNATLLF